MKDNYIKKLESKKFYNIIRIMKIAKILSSIIITGLLALSLVGCNDVLFTNRSRPLLISEGELAKSGADNYEAIKQESKLITNNAQYFMVTRVGTRVAQAAVNTMKEAKQDVTRRWAYYKQMAAMQYQPEEN